MIKRRVNARFEGGTGLRARDITGLTELEALGYHRRKESRKLLENKRNGDVLKLRACGRLLPWHPPGITHRIANRISPKFVVTRLQRTEPKPLRLK